MTAPLGPARAPREVELKFHLPKGSRSMLEKHPALAALDPCQHHLVSTYFDTPDRALDQSGLTLRVRRDGDRRIQTVKSRSNGHGLASSRAEWEWPIDQDTPELAWLKSTKRLAAAALAIKGRLQPAFITDIRRTTRLVHLGGDTTVEVAIDEGDIEVDLAHEAVSELEVELKGGCVGPLYQFAAGLLSTAPLWLMSESKASRGWRLRTGQNEGAQLARPLKLKQNVSAAEGFRQILGGTLGHLIGNIGPTLSGDPEGLHQSRIAIREARATLRLFDQYLDPDRAEGFGARLRTFGEILGAARDWDVLCLETLPAAKPALSTERLEDLNAPAEVERQRAHRAVGTALCGSEFTGLLLGLAIWAEDRAIASSRHSARLLRQSLATLAPSLLDRALDRVQSRGRRIGQLSKVERHGLRKSLKKLNFDVVCLARFYEARGVKRYRQHCEELAKILGAVNDGVVTDRLRLQLMTAGLSDLSNPANALGRWNKQRGRKALKSLQSAMKEFCKAPKFWI